MRGSGGENFNITPMCISHFVKISDVNKQALTVTYAIFIPLIVIANLLLVIGIMKVKRKELTMSQILFILLALSDISLGVVHLPIQLFLLQTDTIITCLQLQLRGFWFTFPMILSGNTMVIIAIDRFIHVTKKRPTRKLLKGLIIVNVLITFTWSIIYAFLSDDLDIKAAAKYFISLSMYEGIGLAISVLLNILLLGNVQKQTRNSSINKNRLPAKNFSVKRKSDSLTTTIVLISITLVITYIPSVAVLNVAAYTFLFSSDQEKIGTVPIAITWSLVPAQLNAILNSVIYISRNRKIKRYFKRLIRGEDFDGITDTSCRSASILRLDTLSSIKRVNSGHENHAINKENSE